MKFIALLALAPMLAPTLAIGSVQIAASLAHTCALEETQLACWGRNEYGEAPRLVRGFRDARQVVVGLGQTCVLDADGVWCLGARADQVPALDHPTMIASGYEHVCALDADGVKCWGSGYYGQATVPPGLREVRAVVAGTFHTCALAAGGVRCWGDADYEQMAVPKSLRDVSEISAGGYRTCVRHAEGVKCWGFDGSGHSIAPTVAGALSLGGGHTCALDQGRVQCWGSDEYGQIQVPADLREVSAIAAGLYHTCAVGAEGVKCWGNDGYGQVTVPQPLFPNPLSRRSRMRRRDFNPQRACLADCGDRRGGDKPYLRFAADRDGVLGH